MKRFLAMATLKDFRSTNNTPITHWGGKSTPGMRTTPDDQIRAFAWGTCIKPNTFYSLQVAGTVLMLVCTGGGEDQRFMRPFCPSFHRTAFSPTWILRRNLYSAAFVQACSGWTGSCLWISPHSLQSSFPSGSPAWDQVYPCIFP